MKHRLMVMLALAAGVSAIGAERPSLAQTPKVAARPQSRANYPQPQYGQPVPPRMAQAQPRMAQAQPRMAQVHPPVPQAQPPVVHSHATAGGYPGEVAYGGVGYEQVPPGGYVGEGYHSDGCCESHGTWDDCYCDSCGGSDCGGSCWNRGGLSASLFGCVCPPGRYYFTADYLYLRANFSEAVAFLEQTDNTIQGVGTDVFHELDFGYESSYRLGGGYRLCGCDEEVRFMFTRLSSVANDVAPSGSFLAYEVSAPPGGETRIHADVDVKSFDLAFAKTIPLGGPMGCGCGDPCGCGDSCCNECGCPAWDVTWTGGLRFADVDWNRTYTAVNTNEFVTTNAVSVMDFQGGGLRIGLEGRRYFFPNGCMSVYLKGDISLLLGDVKLGATRVTDDPTTPNQQDTLNTQTFRSREIIPITELETGLTGHITCNTSFTTGYVFSAWHDLGFRDEFNFPTLMETRYDDGNILGFDGFFARLEVAY